MSVHRAAGTSPDPPDPRMRSGTQQICCDHVPASWGSVKSGPQQWQQLQLLQKEITYLVTLDSASPCSFLPPPVSSPRLELPTELHFVPKLSGAAEVAAGVQKGALQPRSSLLNVNRTFLVAFWLLNRGKRFTNASVRAVGPSGLNSMFASITLVRRLGS